MPAVRTSVTPTAPRLSNATAPATAGAASGAAPLPTADPGATELVVSVVGLVHKTGLIRSPAGSRVADAIAAAGGSRDGADLTGLNLAQRLLDGDQVLIGPPAPTGPPSGQPQLGSTTIGAGGRALNVPSSGSGQPQSGSATTGSGGHTPAVPSSGSGRPPGSSARVDLNKATESDLDVLFPGVGPSTARAIIAWRSTNGLFAAVEQLSEVDGIGPARLASAAGSGDGMKVARTAPPRSAQDFRHLRK